MKNCSVIVSRSLPSRVTDRRPTPVVGSCLIRNKPGSGGRVGVVAAEASRHPRARPARGGRGHARGGRVEGQGRQFADSRLPGLLRTPGPRPSRPNDGAETQPLRKARSEASPHPPPFFPGSAHFFGGLWNPGVGEHYIIRNVHTRENQSHLYSCGNGPGGHRGAGSPSPCPQVSSRVLAEPPALSQPQLRVRAGPSRASVNLHVGMATARDAGSIGHCLAAATV